METVLACHVEFPRYTVASDGAVVSHVSRTARMLRPIRMGLYVGFQLLDSAGTRRNVYQHRLVTEVFHGAAPAGGESRHRDGTRTNNSAANLHWGTRSQNMRDKEAHGTAPKGERHPQAKLTDEQVRLIREWHAAGVSPTVAMNTFGISRMTHWRAAARRSWTHIT